MIDTVTHTDDDVPAHAEGVRLVERDGVHALLADHFDQPLVLDSMGLALWELCDGETTVAEMVQASLLLFDASAEEVRTGITEALDVLTRAGAVRWVSPEP